MNTEEKLILARQLEKLGVDINRGGVPIASEGDFDAVRQIAREIKKSQVAGLARANKVDIEPCLAGNKRRLLIPASILLSLRRNIHLKYQLKKAASKCSKKHSPPSKLRALTRKMSNFHRWTPRARIENIW